MQESDSSEWNKSMTDRSKKKKKFECGCGKVYNSAASLSTHVKLQHNGVVPLLLNRLWRSRRNRTNHLAAGPNNTSTNS